MAEKYRNTPKGRIAPNGYRLCDPLPAGQILLDNEKKQWVIGKPIGLGGFGEIYLCYEKSDSTMKDYVMKLDNNSGPLFVEVNFVLRACQKATISSFMENRGLTFLGIPKFITSGTHQSKNGGYRFLIMERLGEELQKVLETNRLSIRVTCRIACRIIDVLEYIHDQGYIHADIKAQNILRAYYGNTKKKSKRSHDEEYGNDEIDEDDKYYLIDYGLAERYMLQGVHKPYEFDKRKANNGTAEFRSRDAHIGVISRRSDIESLGFNLILWFYGRHPWGHLLKNPDHVNEKKCWAMKNIDLFLKEAFSNEPLTTNGGGSSDSKSSKTPKSQSKPVAKKSIPVNCVTPKGFNKFFQEINKLSHDERPDYSKLKDILLDIARLNNDDRIKAPSSSLKKKSRLSKENSLTRNVETTPNVVSRVGKRKINPPTNGVSKSLFKVKAEIDSSDDETEVEEIVTSNTRTKNSKLRNGAINTPINGTKTSYKKKCLTTNNTINQKSNKTNGKARKLRNRIQIDEEDSDDLTKDLISYSKSKKLKTPPVRVPRLSTPLLMVTPPDGGDSPLFGPFEPDVSINEDRSYSSRNSLSLLSRGSNNDEDRKLRSCRIYINNKRCCPRQSSQENVYNHNSSLQTQLSSTECSSEEDEVKPTANNCRAKKQSKNISNSSNKANRLNGIKRLNGRAKTNGSLSTTSSSSTVKSTSRKTKTTSSSTTSDKYQTSTPITTVPIVETAAMQRIRLLMEKKKQGNSVNSKK